MSDHIVQLEMENKMLKEDQVITNEKIIGLEYQQTIYNLLFDGFDEIKGETDMDCYKVRRAIAIIYEKQNPNDGNESEDAYELAGRIVVNRIHWNGKFQIGWKRAIIVDFQNYTDRQFVIGNCKLLPEGIYINEDFTMEIQARHNILWPILKHALKWDKYKGMVSLSYDRLVVNGVHYKLSDLANLPVDISTLKHVRKKMKMPSDSREYIPPSVTSMKPTSNTMENNITVLSSLHNLNVQRCLMMILPNKKL